MENWFFNVFIALCFILGIIVFFIAPLFLLIELVKISWLLSLISVILYISIVTGTIMTLEDKR